MKRYVIFININNISLIYIKMALFFFIIQKSIQNISK